MAFSACISGHTTRCTTWARHACERPGSLHTLCNTQPPTGSVLRCMPVPIKRGLGSAGVRAQQPRLSLERASRMSARLGHPSQAGQQCPAACYTQTLFWACEHAADPNLYPTRLLALLMQDSGSRVCCPSHDSRCQWLTAVLLLRVACSLPLYSPTLSCDMAACQGPRAFALWAAAKLV